MRLRFWVSELYLWNLLCFYVIYVLPNRKVLISCQCLARGRMTRVEDHPCLLLFRYKLAGKKRARMKNDRKGADMKRLSDT